MEDVPVGTKIRNALEDVLGHMGYTLNQFAEMDIECVEANIVPNIIGLLYNLPDTREQITNLVRKQWSDLKAEKITQEVFGVRGVR